MRNLHHEAGPFYSTVHSGVSTNESTLANMDRADPWISRFKSRQIYKEERNSPLGGVYVH